MRGRPPTPLSRDAVRHSMQPRSAALEASAPSLRSASKTEGQQEQRSGVWTCNSGGLCPSRQGIAEHRRRWICWIDIHRARPRPGRCHVEGVVLAMEPVVGDSPTLDIVNRGSGPLQHARALDLSENKQGTQHEESNRETGEGAGVFEPTTDCAGHFGPSVVKLCSCHLHLPVRIPNGRHSWRSGTGGFPACVNFGAYDRRWGSPYPTVTRLGDQQSLPVVLATLCPREPSR